MKSENHLPASRWSLRMDNLRLWLVLAFFIGIAAYAIIVMALNPV